MKFKQSITYGLLTLLSITTVEAQANPCCCRPIRCCCLPPLKSNLHHYIDIGLGQSISSRLSGSDNFFPAGSEFGTSNSFSLTPQKMAVENTGAIESGVVWAQPLLSNSTYLPYASLGLRYQYSNLNNDRTAMRFTYAQYSNNGELTNQQFSDAYYDFSQHSVLANLKVDLFRWQRVMPYVNVGIGPTWYKIKQKTPLYYNLTDTASNTTELNTGHQTGSHFTYILGAGLDFPITQTFSLSVGYQYNHLGDISLTPQFVGLNTVNQKEIDDTNINGQLQPIHLGNLNTHTLQFTGRFMFG